MTIKQTSEDADTGKFRVYGIGTEMVGKLPLQSSPFSLLSRDNTNLNTPEFKVDIVGAREPYHCSTTILTRNGPIGQTMAVNVPRCMASVAGAPGDHCMSQKEDL